MTYKRPDRLKDTIQKLFEQSIIPEKVLVVDNDPNQSASSVVDSLSHFNLQYHTVGYNSGPAGAAKIGLQILAEQGYQWISWIDDDDPPVFNDTFETLLKLGNENRTCGCVGAVGQRFNMNNGLMVRIADEELEGEGFVAVDNIAGGMSKIVNASVVIEKNILPDEKLFYGFEELDFDIRIKKAGYSILADKKLYNKHRMFFKRKNISPIRSSKKNPTSIWREYYSIRNMLFILNKHKKYLAIIITMLRGFYKTIVAYKHGFAYGKTMMAYVISGIIHFLKNRKGPYIQNNA